MNVPPVSKNTVVKTVTVPASVMPLARPHEASQQQAHRALVSWFAVVTAMMAIVFLAIRPVQAADGTCAVNPDTSYQPQQVVELVVESLRTNDAEDSGILQVFCFASPDNKSVTGPLERFTRMIKQGYGDMLNHRDSYFDDMEVSNGVAMQPVWLITPDGDEVGYLFRLGLQQEGEFDGMWMTDAVSRIQRRDGDRKSI